MKYIIQVKLMNGSYRSYNKTFNSDFHFDNWLSFIEKRGIKVIGINKEKKNELN